MTNEEKMYSLGSYASGACSGMVRICDLQEFSGHPFKVVKDAAMYELMESIRLEGVLEKGFEEEITKEKGGKKRCRKLMRQPRNSSL